MSRLFLLSPAHLGGKRAALLFSPRARFGLALRLLAGESAELGEIYSFVSGLYFRGKLAYALAFADPPAGCAGVLTITPDRGLVDPSTLFNSRDLKALSKVDIHHENRRYCRALLRDAGEIARAHPGCEVVLLGSIASEKYTRVLLECFGERLLFPSDFVGRGDLSRGGLMLRAVSAGNELPYLRIAGAVVNGCRPPRLAPIR